MQRWMPRRIPRAMHALKEMTEIEYMPERNAGVQKK
jgi:hypothetical protein